MEWGAITFHWKWYLSTVQPNPHFIDQLYYIYVSFLLYILIIYFILSYSLYYKMILDCDKISWTSRWGSFGDPNGVYKGVEMLRVYEMALKTWSDWLEVHVNRNKTHLFFVSMSPTHERYIYPSPIFPLIYLYITKCMS